MLLQEGHPPAYVSKPLGPKTHGLSIYEKEYLAILIAIEHWHSYLQLAEFTIFTDQKSLTHLNDQQLHIVWQQRVFTKLLGLRYRIIYKKGSENSAADALSRRQHASEVCCAISAATPQWCADIVEGYHSDPHVQALITKLSTRPTEQSKFSFQDGLLRFQKRIWVGNNQTLQQQLIVAFHSSPLGGHSGIPATIKCLRDLFAWPGLKQHVEHFVHSCPTCQQAKVERVKYPGLLQPFQTPEKAW